MKTVVGKVTNLKRRRRKFIKVNDVLLIFLKYRSIKLLKMHANEIQTNMT